MRKIGLFILMFIFYLYLLDTYFLITIVCTILAIYFLIKNKFNIQLPNFLDDSTKKYNKTTNRVFEEYSDEIMIQNRNLASENELDLYVNDIFSYNITDEIFVQVQKTSEDTCKILNSGLYKDFTNGKNIKTEQTIFLNKIGQLKVTEISSFAFAYSKFTGFLYIKNIEKIGKSAFSDSKFSRVYYNPLFKSTNLKSDNNSIQKIMFNDRFK